MTALVVFESMFGNTETIARSIAAGLAARLGDDVVEVVEVGDAPAALPAGVDLLVVGGPTHAFGMSRRGTRQSARQQADGPLVSTGGGIREWLGSLEVPPGPRIAAAAFDTRIPRPRLPGSASGSATRRLRTLGFRIVARRCSFWVTGVKGPLRAGEVERAREWGDRVAAEATTSTAQPARAAPRRRPRSRLA
ncbi:MAG TPA: flavodoxin domain-containing protein [Acidimicrobiales bacterium]|nr:flavodoxin domain-containing protein [Acidimicrobiales bacterium]